MRNLTFALVTLTVLAGTIAGCGDSSSSAPHAIAGSGGGANAGAPGAGSGGTTVSAGAGGATAGAPADTAGTGGAIAGAGGDVSGAGTGGATAGAPAGGAAPTPCDNVPNKPLPFSIAADFPIEHVLTEGSAASWQNIANPDCDATTFPAFPSGGAGGGGGSGGASAGAGGASAGTGGTAGTAGSGGTGGTAGSAGTGGASAGTGGTAGTSGTGGTGGTAGTAGASGGGGVSGAAGTSGGAGMSGSAGSAGTGGMSGAGGGSAQAPACYEFAYNPDPCINSGTGSVCWAGMIFQPTDMMGPAIKGVCIQPGANAIEFSARSSRDAARVKFGSIRPGVDSTEHWLNLTTTWTKYTITIPDTDAYTYDASSTDPAGGVWNGFSVVVEPADHTGGSYILVKDVVWKKQ